MNELIRSIHEEKITKFRKHLKEVSVKDIDESTPPILMLLFTRFYLVKQPNYEKSVEMINLVLDKGANTDIIEDKGFQSSEHFTALHLACAFTPEYDIIRKMVPYKWQFDRTTLFVQSKITKRTPLHIASAYGNYEVIECLIDRGAIINKTSAFMNTPLHYASFNKDSKVAKLLIEKGADVNARDSFNRTPLHIASALCNLELIKLYRDNGANLDAQEDYKQTSLHYTTSNIPNVVGWKESAELQRITIDVNAVIPTIDMDTVLYSPKSRYVLKNWEERVLAAVLLIKYGADRNIKDVYGKTAFENGHASSKDIKGRFGTVNNLQSGLAKQIEKKLTTGPKISSMFNFENEPSKHTIDQFREIIQGDYASVLSNMTSILKYTDENNVKHDVPIITIPKGTLLFRSIRGDDQADYCGIEIGKIRKERCLHKNHNVFFYPFPGYSGLYAVANRISAFVVEREMKLLNLRNPATIHRANKDNKDIYFRDCNTIEKSFCNGLIGRRYDPCFSEHFIERNPDVVGMITLAKKDTVNSHMGPYHNEKTSRYSVFSQDSRKVQGIPEFILYPLETRNLKEIRWTLDDCKKKGKHNYSEFFEHNDIQSRAYSIFSKLEKYLSPKGVQKKHVTIFSPLKLFVVYEHMEEKYKKDCVPLIFDANSKLNTFQTDVNKLNQPLYSQGRHIKTKASQMKEIDTFDQEQKPKNERLKMSAIQELPSKMEQVSPDDKVYTVKGNVHDKVKPDTPMKKKSPQITSTRSNRPVISTNNTQKVTNTVFKKSESASKKIGIECDNDTECFTKLCVFNNITKKKKCKPKGMRKRVIGDECKINDQCSTRKCDKGFCAN